MHPATWLNGKRWEDEGGVPVATPKPQKNPWDDDNYFLVEFRRKKREREAREAREAQPAEIDYDKDDPVEPETPEHRESAPETKAAGPKPDWSPF